MSQISLKNISKSFKVAKRSAGLISSLKSVVKRDYTNVQALNEVSFTIEQGELLGYIGPNGAGKSTTIKIITGEFDRTLLRPRSTVLQVMGHDFELSRAGRLAQALVVMVISLNLIGFSGGIDKLFVLVFAIFGGIMLMAGLFILGATFSFWSIQSIEIVNIFTDGGREMGQYPVSIYQKWFARFFTFIVPLGCINYYPLLFILGKTGVSSAPLWIGAISPLAGFIFLGVSLLIWRVGVRHYRSTGS